MAQDASRYQFEKDLREHSLFDEFNARVIELQQAATDKPQKGAAYRQARFEFIEKIESLTPQQPEPPPRPAVTWELVPKATFAGTECSPSEGVAWAAARADQGDVTPEDCPGPIGLDLAHLDPQRRREPLLGERLGPDDAPEKDAGHGHRRLRQDPRAAETHRHAAGHGVRSMTRLPTGNVTASAIRWTAGALCQDGITRDDAPSSEAWACYRWAAATDETRDRFLATMLPRILPTTLPNAAAVDDGDDVDHELIEQLLAEAAAHMEQIRAERQAAYDHADKEATDGHDTIADPTGGPIAGRAAPGPGDREEG